MKPQIRKVTLALLLLLASGAHALGANSITSTSSTEGVSGSVTLTRTSTGLSYNWSATRAQSPEREGQIWIRKVSGDGVTTGTTIIDTGTGGAASASGTGTVTGVNNGDWFLTAARVLNFATSSVIDGPVYQWMQVQDIQLYKYYVKFTNNSAFPARYKLVGTAVPSGEIVEWDGTSTHPLGTLTGVLLQPGESYIATIAADGTKIQDVEVVYTVEGVDFTDGQWIVSEGAVTAVKGVDVSGSVGQLASIPVEDTVTPPQPNDVPSSVPVTPPATPQTSPGTTLWKSTTDSLPADLLTKSVYREGVDKTVEKLDAIKKAIEGTAVSPQNLDSSAPEGWAPSAKKSDVLAAVAKLPQAPAVTMPGEASTAFALSFVPPGMSAPVTMNVDFTDYSGPISVFKGIVRGVLAIWFFFITIRAIREAFAS